MTADQASGVSQQTAYLYGVGGTAGTNLFSNDLISKTEYPDKTTGVASTSAANDQTLGYDFRRSRPRSAGHASGATAGGLG